MIAMDVTIPSQVIETLYPFVQKHDGAGQWITMAFDVVEKENQLIFKAFACNKKRLAKQKKKTKADYKKAIKEIEESKEVEYFCVEDDPNAEAADKPKDEIAKGHLKEFTKAMVKIGSEDKKPAVGLIEFLGKIFFVTFIDENKCDSKLKMAYSGCRKGAKAKFDSVNCDVEAMDLDELGFKAFKSQCKEI